MLWCEFSQVPDIAIDDDPAVFWGVVFGDLLNGDGFWSSHCQDSIRYEEERKRDNCHLLPPYSWNIGRPPYLSSWLTCRRGLIGEVEGRIALGGAVAETKTRRLASDFLAPHFRHPSTTTQRPDNSNADSVVPHWTHH